MPVADILAVSALDSSGGAGINQYVRIAALHGTSLYTVNTGVSLQYSSFPIDSNESKGGVESNHPVSANLLQTQLDFARDNYSFGFMIIGALCHPEQIDILHRFLEAEHAFTVILDPVLSPSSGKAFITPEALPAYQKLLHHADFLTPNLPELSLLSGREITCFVQAIEAATELSLQYDLTVLLKGGHGEGDRIEEAVVTGREVSMNMHPRHHWSYAHGTGCAFVTTFAVLLSQGMAPAQALPQASAWVASFYNRLNGIT